MTQNNWTTDREGNEIHEGDIVYVKINGHDHQALITKVVNPYQIIVQFHDGGASIEAHVSDTALAEHRG